MASVAALAALNLQQTPAGVAHVALQRVWPKLWLDHQQTSDEAAPLVTVASVTASLVAAGGGAVLGGIEASQASHWQVKCQLEHSNLVSNQVPGRVHTCEGIFSMREVPK